MTRTLPSRAPSAGSVAEVTDQSADGLQIPPNCDLTLGMRRVGTQSPGHTVWEVRAHERFANPAGVIQGGIVASVCDSAMGASTVTFCEGRPVRIANTDLRTSFLRPVRVGALLTCDAAVVSGGRRVVFAEATVRDEDGVPLARASATYLVFEAE
jgi:uncharacterized protein (TIGR00369 family)